MTRIIPKKDAISKANDEFYRRHPERKGKPLTQSAQDAKLRAEWVRLFKSYQGQTVEAPPNLSNPQALQSRCTVENPKTLSVFVYLYKARADGHGHVGLVLKQKDGSYVRYSQAAVNTNLQGWDRWEYFVPMQKVHVRKKSFLKNTNPKHFARGAEIIGLPTKFLGKIQKAVNEYINSEWNYYNIVTNNCADFVNDSINAADDISVSDATIPVDYFVNLVKKYSGCQIR